MKLILCVIFTLFFFSKGIHCHAQTIINAERLGNMNDSLKIALSFQYNGNYGNANTTKLKMSPVISVIRRNYDIKLFGGYSILSKESTSILNSGFVHLRHNYKFTDRLRSFEFYQIQYNEVLLLTKREVFGAGLRYNLTNNDSLEFDLGIGLMRENEFLNATKLLEDEKTVTKYIRAAIVGNFIWILNDQIRLNNVFYYQPHLSNFDDFRFLNDFSLTVKVKKHIAFLATIVMRYDNEAPSALTSLDISNSVGLTLSY